MTKKPSPVEYDESIVQKLDYVPASHAGHDDPHRWSGGFFAGGPRNSDPAANSDGSRQPVDIYVALYAGLGALAAISDASRTKVCSGCHRVLRLSEFSPKPGREYVLRSRCDRCVERGRAGRAAKD